MAAPSLADFLSADEMEALYCPPGEARSLPGRAYGAAFYELEQRKLLPKLWRAVGFASDSPEPGDAILPTHRRRAVARTRRRPHLRIMRRALALPFVLALAACAADPAKGTYRPAVDMTGKILAEYDYDLLVCRENARQEDVVKGVVLGAFGGAALGALGGAIAGSAGTGAALGAAGGAVVGGAAASAVGDVKTATEPEDPYAKRIRACLAERGYTVLDRPAAKPGT